MVKGKKRLMYVALTAASVISLSGCNEVTATNNGEILTYSYNGSEVSIKTDDIVTKYLKEDKNSHASALYDALYEIIVRRNFEDGGKLASYKETVTDKANESITKAKETADDNGQSWEKYLEAQGYTDSTMTVAEKEHELFLKNIYSEMTTTVDDQFFDRFKGHTDGLSTSTDELQKKYNLLNGSEGWIQKYVPYHVKHILVQNDASQEYGYSRGQISSDNAHNLFEVINNLANGSSFTDVANRFSQDPGNGDGGNKKGGEYIMATDAGFVNEFQLGIYAWDLLLSNNGELYKSSNESLYNSKLEHLFVNDDAKETIEDISVAYIPFGVVAELDEVKDKTTVNSITVNDNDPDYYPRNILFNKYFQNRNVGFITNETAFDYDALKENGTGGLKHTREDNVSGEKVWSDLDDNGNYKTTGVPYFADEQAKAFQEITFKDGSKKKVLCDTDGNPIIVVRNKESSSGVHFIIVERSGFDDTDINFTVDSVAGTTEDYKTTLNEYYAPVNPKNKEGINAKTGKPEWVEAFPHVETTVNGETVYLPKKTYVQKETVGPNSFVNNSVTNYQERVDTLSTNIKKQINSYNKYYWLNSGLDITLKDILGVKAQELVDKYIEKELVNTDKTNAKDFDEKWISYATSLEKQVEERKYTLLPEVLAAGFGDAELYKEGQPGYKADMHSIGGDKA